MAKALNLHRVLAPLLVVLAGIGISDVARAQGESAPTERVDLLTFANGLIPLGITGTGVDAGATMEQLVEATDGDPTPRTMNLRHITADAAEFVMLFRLPSLTTLDRLAVPNVLEVPSAGTSFAREIEVDGSAIGPDAGFERLAHATLTAHSTRGQETVLTIDRATPVRWLRVRLSGAMDPQAVFIEFSELIGNGTQEPVAMLDHFTGSWSPRTGSISLRQNGAVVTGCADGGRKSLQGTVTGNLLYATLVDNHTGIPGAMVLSVEDDGALWGLRSDNGGPFRVFQGAAESEVDTSTCFPDDTDSIGCESVVHGLLFGHDSADLLPDSAPVLDALYRGLSIDPAGLVSITGHTSSDGAEAYNQELSVRRAQAVVDALVDRGIDRARLRATGRGEAEPIARNDTEAGRRLNRRVEVSCATP